MTDKERYKRTFSLLRASQEDFMEVKAMNDNVRILPVRKLAALCAAVVLVVAMATVAYAADVGGIRRAVQIWIHGDQTNAVLDIRGNSYNLSYEDEDGNPRSIGGGGVAIGSGPSPKRRFWRSWSIPRWSTWRMAPSGSTTTTKSWKLPTNSRMGSATSS